MSLIVQILAVLILAGPQNAEDPAAYFRMSLEELMNVPVVVEGASRYRQELRSAPACVTVITSEQIRLSGYQNLSQVLDSVVGLYTTYDRNYYYTGVRGFRRPGDYDSRILVLVNGIRVNDNIADSARIGWELPIDIDLIERVEVIKGPGSSIYGSNALLAVVNIVTKSGQTTHDLEVSGQVSDYQVLRGRITFGQEWDNKKALLVSVSELNDPGSSLYFAEFDTPQTNMGWVENDDTGFRNIFSLLSYGPLSVLITHGRYQKGIPTAPWDTVFADPRTRTEDSSTILAVRYCKSMRDDLQIAGHASYHAYDYMGWYPTDRADPGEQPDIVVNTERWEGRCMDSDIQLICRPNSSNTIICGVEGRYNIKQMQRNWDREVYLDDRRNSWYAGLYLQDELRITSTLSAVAGIRYDHYSTFGDTTNPRCALIARLTDSTTIKLLYGTAFRAPNVYELYYQDCYTMKAAMDLRPETITTYELILEQAINKDLLATVSLYTYRMEDLIDQYTDPQDQMLVFGNIGKVNAKGLEFGLDGRLPGDIRIRSGYALMAAKDSTTDQLLVNCPRHTLRLNLIIPILPDMLFASLAGRHTSKVKTLSGNDADDFTVMDTWLTFRAIRPALELAVGIQNLFDCHYGYPGGGEHVQDVIYQNSRTVFARLIYGFK